MTNNFSDILSRFSDQSKNVLLISDKTARSFNDDVLGTEHLLLGLFNHAGSLAHELLSEFGFDGKKALKIIGELESKDERELANNDPLAFSRNTVLSFQLANSVSSEHSYSFIEPEHLLFGVISQRNSKARRLLALLEIDVVGLEQSLADIFFQTTERGDREERTKVFYKIFPQPDRMNANANSTLAQFSENLNKLASEGKIMPVIGREKEIDRVSTILSRKQKNNPVLIGEPGVGKTAIAEGLALRIVEGKVPYSLADKVIYRLDLPSLIAGTKFRGEFEARLNKLIEEVSTEDNIILFIDELHTVVGAGSAEGSLDASNIIKPALARGNISLIGATTFDEYRKRIEPDQALDRRFQTVTVKEPNLKETKQILKGIKDSYTKFHSVSISDEILNEIVELSDRYIAGRFMPDKAIDVLDEAAAMVNGDRKIVKSEKILNLESKVELFKAKTIEALQNKNIDLANELQEEMFKLWNQIKQEKENIKRGIRLRKMTSEHIKQAVSQISGVPVSNLKRSEAKQLLSLEKTLGKQVIGQTEAIRKVVQAIKRSRSGIASSHRPIGSFIFMGPSGVGKTELARVIAKEYFGSEGSLIKIDMSEFSDSTAVSKALGSNPGYVGYDDGNTFIDKVRKNPYSVVLFDEIEKAHSSVFNLLLQLLEDGTLTSASGRIADFSNTLVILTSNLGAEEMQEEKTFGFDSTTLNNLKAKNDSIAKRALKEFMRAEIINRFDDIIVFNQLEKSSVRQIVKNMLRDLDQRLLLKGIAVDVSENAISLLIDQGFSKYKGARELRKVIETEVELRIAEGIINGEIVSGAVVKVGTKDRSLNFKVSYESTKVA